MSAYPYQQTIDQEAAKYGVPPSLLAGLLKTESDFNPNAQHINPSGSIDRGIGQINNVANPTVTNAQAYDPTFAIGWVAQHLAYLHSQTGSWTTAVGAYNAGLGAVKSNGGAVPSYSQGYVDTVTKWAHIFGWGGVPVIVSSTVKSPTNTATQNPTNTTAGTLSYPSGGISPGFMGIPGMLEKVAIIAGAVLVGLAGLYLMLSDTDAGQKMIKTVKAPAKVAEKVSETAAL